MCTSLLARRLISTLLVDKEALLFSPSPCLDYIKQSRGEGETMERGGGETEVVPGRERGEGKSGLQEKPSMWGTPRAEVMDMAARKRMMNDCVRSRVCMSLSEGLHFCART